MYVLLQQARKFKRGRDGYKSEISDNLSCLVHAVQDEIVCDRNYNVWLVVFICEIS